MALTAAMRWIRFAVLSMAVACAMTALESHLRVIRAEEARTVWDGVYTNEQAARGDAIYGEACASCHGATLLGGEMAPALVGSDFLSNWNGLTVGDLVERVRVSMPQNDPGSLSRQRSADVVALVLRANQFPVGASELPREAELLKQIGIQPTRPEK
jgi:mono/diheme cytochrome c family protein